MDERTDLSPRCLLPSSVWVVYNPGRGLLSWLLSCSSSTSSSVKCCLEHVQVQAYDRYQAR
jgi:hypothetical protein